MAHASERRLREGVTVAVYRNAGLRKVCNCPRRGWAKCPHPWHFNYTWRGAAYRFSLNRYAGKEITGKTEAETLAEGIRREIRAGTFRGLPAAAMTNDAAKEERDEVSFETFARRFIERYSKDRGKASWQDDEYMVKRLGSFQTIEGRPLGEKAVQRVTEDDLEAFIKHLTTQGRASSTRNHYVQVIRAMSRWAVKKGYRDTPMVGDDSDVIRRKKEAQRDRRLEPGEEHYVQHTLGHASLQQTSTYLNATLRGLHESMRNLDQSRPACKPLANKPVRGFRPIRKQAPARSEKSFLH